MKKLLLVAGAAAVVVGGGVASASHYDQYKNKQHQQQVTLAEQAKQAQYKADLAKENLLLQANATLKTECEKGVAAYAKLPLAVQKVVPKPVCAPATSGQ